MSRNITSPCLVVQSGPSRVGERLELLPDRPVRIGKSADNDIVLDDPKVSRKHCRLTPAGDGWLLEDLNSTNGTLVDGQRVQECQLRGHEAIQIGRFVVSLEPGDVAFDSAVAEKAPGTVRIRCHNRPCRNVFEIVQPRAGQEVGCPKCGHKISFGPPAAKESDAESDADKALKRLDIDARSWSPGYKTLQHALESVSVKTSKRLVLQILGICVAVVSAAAVIYFLRSGAEPKTIQVAAPVLEPREVRIQVMPADAEVFVDGAPVDSAEAVESTEDGLIVTVGPKEVRRIDVKADGYEAKRLDLRYGSARLVEIALKPIIKYLQVTSTPPGASVYLEGEPAGKTPGRVEISMLLETAALRVEQAGYRPVERALATSSLPTEPLHFDLAPTAESLAEYNWITLLRDSGLRDRVASYGQPAIRPTEQWEQARTGDSDFLYLGNGDRIAIRITSESVALTTDLGRLELATTVISWVEMVEDAWIVVRTNLGDTFVCELDGPSITYEAATGSLKEIRSEDVWAFVFRRRPASPRTEGLTTVASGVGLNTFLGTDLQGSVRVDTGQGTMSVDAANARCVRRIEDPKDEFHVMSNDGSSVTGRLVAGDLTVQLLCNGKRVALDTDRIGAIEVAPSAVAVQKASRLDQLTQAIAAAEAKMDRLEKSVSEIESENRELVKQRNKRVAQIRQKNKEILNDNRRRERDAAQRGGSIPKGAPLLKVQDDADVQKINGELRANSGRISEVKKAVVKAKREISKLKDEIETLSASLGQTKR